MSHVKTVSNWNVGVCIAKNGIAFQVNDLIGFYYNDKPRTGYVERIGHGNAIVVGVTDKVNHRNYHHAKMDNVQVLEHMS